MPCKTSTDEHHGRDAGSCSPAGVGTLAAIPLVRAGGAGRRSRREIFVSASDDQEGRHFITASDVRGAPLFSVEVEARCHGIVLDPVRSGRAIVMARRPGTVAYELDLHDGTIRRQIRSAADRHFYGHAVFSRDGSVLFTSENDIPRGEGVVTVRDAHDLRVLSEMRSHGVGPHELVLLRDGRTLAVANGGLVTDLADGTRRRDLNIPGMDPSLVYLDSHDGRLLAQVRPDDHFASIRHLAVGGGRHGRDRDAVRGAGDQPVPGGRLPSRRRAASRPSRRRATRLIRMKRYSASVCVAPGGVAAATCPRGDLVAFFDVASGALLRTLRHPRRGRGDDDRRRGKFLFTTGPRRDASRRRTHTEDVVGHPEAPSALGQPRGVDPPRIASDTGARSRGSGKTSCYGGALATKPKAS